MPGDETGKSTSVRMDPRAAAVEGWHDPPERKGLLSLRAKGLVIFALGIMMLFFSFVFSIVLVILDNLDLALMAILIGFAAFSYGVYYRFVGFRRAFVRRYGQTLNRLKTLDRPDIVISPMFLIAGDDLVRDDFGKWAAGLIIIVTGAVLALFYWLLSRLVL